jgi:hypothetical protein
MLQKPNPQQQNDVPDTSETAFKKWMAEVDVAVATRAFVSAYDLPDQPYRDWFEEGLSPDEAAALALEEAGYEDGDGVMSDDFDMFYEGLWG